MGPITKEQKTQIYAAATVKWGVRAQMIAMLEELGELSVAVAKSLNEKCHESAILEEVADVEIMCEQFREWFGSQRIDNIKEGKLAKLCTNLDLNIENLTQ